MSPCPNLEKTLNNHKGGKKEQLFEGENVQPVTNSMSFSLLTSPWVLGVAGSPPTASTVTFASIVEEEKQQEAALIRSREKLLALIQVTCVQKFVADVYYAHCAFPFTVSLSVQLTYSTQYLDKFL